MTKTNKKINPHKIILIKHCISVTLVSVVLTLLLLGITSNSQGRLERVLSRQR